MVQDGDDGDKPTCRKCGTGTSDVLMSGDCVMSLFCVANSLFFTESAKLRLITSCNGYNHNTCDITSTSTTQPDRETVVISKRFLQFTATVSTYKRVSKISLLSPRKFLMT